MIETNAKYNYIRDQQLHRNDGKVPLMPGERQPTLPPIEQLVPPSQLDPARSVAPPGTTPAQRAEMSGDQAGAAAPVPAPAPPEATTPFGTQAPPATAPPTPPPPDNGTSP
jgi:hypothetical protein